MSYTIENPKIVSYYAYPWENNFTGVVKDKFCNIAYYQSGNLHREDGAAVEYTNGDKEWWIHGKIHREDGAAIEFADGDKCWCYNGKCYGDGDDFTVESWIKKWKLEVFK